MEELKQSARPVLEGVFYMVYVEVQSTESMNPLILLGYHFRNRQRLIADKLFPASMQCRAVIQRFHWRPPKSSSRQSSR